MQKWILLLIYKPMISPFLFFLKLLLFSLCIFLVFLKIIIIIYVVCANKNANGVSSQVTIIFIQNVCAHITSKCLGRNETGIPQFWPFMVTFEENQNISNFISSQKYLS